MVSSDDQKWYKFFSGILSISNKLMQQSNGIIWLVPKACKILLAKI